MEASATISGQLGIWPSKRQMVVILRKAGLKVSVGQYSIRVKDCDHFVFQEYRGDLGDPAIDANADSVEEMMRDRQLVSEALSRAGVRHRFEIYDHYSEEVGYLHCNWPKQEEL
ncbi:hypothetical protein [Acaryochloris thomasi]|nr:hypothetical protein [Acaryochloris thomasi]